MSLTMIEGDLSAAGKKFAIVAARWNDIFVARLIEAAVDCLIRHGGEQQNITVVRVPGSFEIPVVVRKLAEKKTVDAVIALGTLIRGETDHYQLIAGDVTSGLSRVSADTGMPVTFGVITADNMEQAMARAGCKAGNKGWEAAAAAIELVNVLDKLS